MLRNLDGSWKRMLRCDIFIISRANVSGEEGRRLCDLLVGGTGDARASKAEVEKRLVSILGEYKKH